MASTRHWGSTSCPDSSSAMHCPDGILSGKLLSFQGTILKGNESSEPKNQVSENILVFRVVSYHNTVNGSEMTAHQWSDW